jgi:hypothetical protein
MRNFIIALILIIVGQSLAYLQLQSQFFWTWAKNNVLLMSLMGFPISIILIYFTKYCALSFNGQVWPGRLIGFAVGAIVFALLSHFIVNEPFTPKTIVCLCLAGCILLIQVLWK